MPYIDWHALVSSQPSTAAPVLSLGDRVSRIFSSQGTAVRHRLAGSLSPTRLLFSKQSVVPSGSISSEDRLGLGWGPLQMPAKNMEIPMKGKMVGSHHPASPTQPQMASQQNNFMPAIIPRRAQVKVATSEQREVQCVQPSRWEFGSCLVHSLTLWLCGMPSATVHKLQNKILQQTKNSSPTG